MYYRLQSNRYGGVFYAAVADDVDPITLGQIFLATLGFSPDAQIEIFGAKALVTNVDKVLFAFDYTEIVRDVMLAQIWLNFVLQNKTWLANHSKDAKIFLELFSVLSQDPSFLNLTGSPDSLLFTFLWGADVCAIVDSVLILSDNFSRSFHLVDAKPPYRFCLNFVYGGNS